MVDVKKEALSVDPMESGIHAAMDRVEAIGFAKSATLIETISNETWDSWDQSKEKALVCDKDGINIVDEDDECDCAAA